jgi:hypothetical protein
LGEGLQGLDFCAGVGAGAGQRHHGAGWAGASGRASAAVGFSAQATSRMKLVAAISWRGPAVGKAGKHAQVQGLQVRPEPYHGCRADRKIMHVSNRIDGRFIK